MKTMNKELLMEKGFAKAARLGYPSYIEQDKITKIYKGHMLRYGKRHGDLFNEEDAERFISQQFTAMNALNTEFPVEMRYI